MAVAGNAALMSLFSLVQMLTWNGKIYWTRLGGTSNGGPFVCHNHLAAYLNVGLGFALGFLILPSRDERWWRPRSARLWGGYALGLIAVGVLSSESRSGFLAMMVASAVTLIIVRPRFLRLWAGVALTLTLIFVFLFAVGMSSPYRRLSTLLERTPYVGDESDSIYSGRLEIWKDVAQAWPRYPVWGTGLGSFATAANRFFRHDTGEYFAHSENEYLEILVEGGVMGLGLALWALIAIARIGCRALESAVEPEDGALIVGALFGEVALAVQCLGDFPLHIPAIAVTAVILTAHIVGLGNRADRQDAGPTGTHPRRFEWTIPVRLALALAALGLLEHGFIVGAAPAALEGSGLQPPGSEMPTAALWGNPMPKLEKIRKQLEESLWYRPDWAEGHVRLGVILMSQYESSVASQLTPLVNDPRRVAALADPLRLHLVAHSATTEQLVAAGGLLAQEPVRNYLVPAARSFLQARCLLSCVGTPARRASSA